MYSHRNVLWLLRPLWRLLRSCFSAGDLDFDKFYAKVICHQGCCTNYIIKIMASLSKNNSHARIIFYAAVGVMIANWRKQLYKRKQVKRFWRRGIFRGRKLHSEYYTLYQSLRASDREFHYRYLRMSKERFNHLLSLVRDKITKKNTKMREAIAAEERLVITIRYLSAGMSQQTLSHYDNQITNITPTYFFRCERQIWV